jgi:hypothetical protein
VFFFIFMSSMWKLNRVKIFFGEIGRYGVKKSVILY